MTMTAQRASMPVLGRVGETPENRDAFFDLAVTWISAAARIEHAARIEKRIVAKKFIGLAQHGVRDVSSLTE
jgi:hypothetical protein